MPENARVPESPRPPAIVDPPPLDRAFLDALPRGYRYFNVAGSGPTMPIARGAMESYGRWLDGVAMFSHVGFAAYDAALAEARADLAAFVGDPGGAGRIALLQSATAALNVAVLAARLAPRARFVTTDLEHASALLPVFARRERGDEVVVLSASGDDGSFLARLDDALRPGGALLLSHVSHKDGRVLPVREACALARERDVLTIVDGAQAVGQISVDVRALGCDAYCLLGHKWLHGPLGTGALWLRDPASERLVPPVVGWRSREASTTSGLVTLKSSAERFESGTVDPSSFVGLRQALAVHRALGARVFDRVRALRGRVLASLAELPLEVRSRPSDPTGIVAVRPRRGDVETIVGRAWKERGVVIKALVAPDEPPGIRISFWYLHDDASVDDLAGALAALV